MRDKMTVARDQCPECGCIGRHLGVMMPVGPSLYECMAENCDTEWTDA